MNFRAWPPGRLEETTLLRMTEVISLIVASDGGFQPRTGALSGPTFAKEVARGDPTAITIASPDTGLAETIQREFSDTIENRGQRT